MNRYVILLILLFIGSGIYAQNYRKTNFEAPLKAIVWMGNPAIQNYDPMVVHLDQHPVPYFSQMYKKKQIVNARRNQKPQGSILSKTQGVASNPSIDTGWAANSSSGVPMDNDIAISNDGIIISAVNANLFIYDTLGNRLMVRGVLGLDSSLGIFTRASDPRLLYDPNHDRFILVCFTGNTSTTSNILVGFTATNDPRGDWNFYTLSGNPFNDSTWSDYPIISISDNDLFMTFNQIQDNVSWQFGFRQSVIYQIDKMRGYNAESIQYTLWDSIKFNEQLYRNICPAKYQENEMGSDMYFLSVRNVDLSNDSVFVIHIDDSYQSGVAKMTQRAIQSPIAYGFPPNVPMNNGNYLMTNDGRVLAAIYENDHIHFGANSVNTAYNNAGVLLGEIENVSSSNPSINAQIFSDAVTEYGYPSMVYVGKAPGDHRVLYNFSHCYTDSFPGVTALYKDAAGNYSDLIRIVEGTGSFNRLTDTNERWGDYSGIQQQYNNPGTVYLAGTYALGGSYKAWVSKLKDTDDSPVITTPSIDPNVPIYPNPVDDRFTVQFKLDRQQELAFNLYDVNGRLVRQLMKQNCNVGQNEFSFNKGVLSQGVYYLVIGNDKEKLVTESIRIN